MLLDEMKTMYILKGCVVAANMRKFREFAENALSSTKLTFIVFCPQPEWQVPVPYPFFLPVRYVENIIIGNFGLWLQVKHSELPRKMRANACKLFFLQFDLDFSFVLRSIRA